MLEKLEVLNGKMSLEFDPLNTKYTILIDNHTSKLDFIYELKEGANIEVEGNDNLENNSDVAINVFNEKEKISYFFKIYKEENEEVNKISIDSVDLEVPAKSDFFEYAGPTIACTCFLLILFLFVFLFHRKKSK